MVIWTGWSLNIWRKVQFFINITSSNVIGHSPETRFSNTSSCIFTYSSSFFFCLSLYSVPTMLQVLLSQAVPLRSVPSILQVLPFYITNSPFTNYVLNFSSNLFTSCSSPCYKPFLSSIPFRSLRATHQALPSLLRALPSLVIPLTTVPVLSQALSF